jgi:23S rRNA (pseudouridine1915-N3)-methyltransferase
VRITIAAVGRMRGQPEAELFDDYCRRLPWPMTLKEVEERGRHAPAELMRREGEKLRLALPDANRLVALDVTGKQMDSEAFAGLLSGWRDDGIRELAFVIGGANGLDAALLDRADMRLSLGRMTWPHMLARVMLAEQLFRAASILAGHPYHKA